MNKIMNNSHENINDNLKVAKTQLINSQTEFMDDYYDKSKLLFMKH